MPIEEATEKAQQSGVADGTTSAEEGVKKAKGRKRSRRPPDQPDQKGEAISPLTPLPVTELPQDFDFIASKTDEEKIKYIQSILSRSEDEAIAVIAPALRFYGTAGSVVQAYLPLILEVKKHLCRPGRPRVDPATGERSKTWAEVCEENLHISIRRMQQILASLQEPKLPGKGGTTNRRPAVDRKDYERARQVAAPARSLAEAVVKQGMGDRFPDAIEILKLADIPVPDVEPAAIIAEVNPEPDWKGILTELAATLEQYGDRLPIPVIKVLKTTEELLDGKAKPQVVSKSGVSTKRHLILKNQEGGTTMHASPLSGRVNGSHGGTYGSEGEVEANRERLNSSPIAEPPVPGAAGAGQPEAAETLGGEPISPGDWVTTDSTTKYLGQFQGKKGKRFILAWYDKPSKKWCPKPKLTDGVHRRLSLEEVREKFPGALEAWGASQAATAEPALRPSLKTVSGSAASSATDVPAGEPPKGSLFESTSAPSMNEAEEIRNAQPGQLPPRKPMATGTGPFRVKKRITGDIIDFVVVRDGDKLPDEVFNNKDEAVSHCESLNKSPVASILPQHVNSQSAAQSAPY
jgi:hypothetical protein